MTSSSSKPAQSMADLMAKFGKDIHTVKKGQEVSGIITSIASGEIIMRIENKTDALILEKDRRLHKQLISLFNVGDEVKAVVLYPESDSGYPIVSVRGVMEEKMWKYVEELQKNGEKVSVTVIDTTKGGLVVEMDNGIQGFLPNSHMMKVERVEDLLGQKIQASIVEVNRENKKVVFSQKGALSPEDAQKIARDYKTGTKVHGTVSGITQFGIFVTLPYQKTGGEMVTIDGLVHISQVAWEKVADLQEVFTLGQEVDAVVIGTDSRSKRIDLSIKQLSKDPFQTVLDSFPVDKKVTGEAGEMTEQGLVIDLGEVDGIAVEGLIKKDKIPPTTTYEKGQKVTATVVMVDARKRKVMLTPVLMEKPLMYR